LWVMDAVEHICPIALEFDQARFVCWVYVTYCEDHLHDVRDLQFPS